ncbi:hypothetical protein G3N18_06575 [Microbacterium sp. 2C]|uniref:hypothetical protein n=1 Tax=Microbacterium paulum TaxID=2707006 RepID=UPI0018C21703|nr:hypothetical protein [Microbacterium paulum]MBG0717745.1 hypothetical protein [Microbacterium paulum]
MRTVLDAIDAANARVRDALSVGRMDAVPDLMAEVEELEKQRALLLREMTRPPVAEVPFSPGPSLRVKVISTLRLVQRPLAARFVTQIARARFDYVIDTSALASMRRDELRSYRAYAENPHGAQSKTQLVVPALSFDRYTPVRGVLALSDWDMSRRLIGPASPRVDVMLATQTLTRLVLDNPQAPWAPAVDKLVVTIGRSLMPFIGRAASPTMREVDAAVIAELEAIEPEDREERAAATARARAQLTGEQQLFGVAALGAVGRRVS